MTDDDQEWITSALGGSITRFHKTTAGRSRGTWLVDVKAPDGTISELVLRRDTGDGPLSGTVLSLERESHVYRALGATEVPVPSLLAVSDDSMALLVERIEGTEDLLGLDTDTRERLVGSFVDAVVALHAVDPDSLDLPGFHRPADPADHALGDLALWQGILDECVGQPLPVLKLAMSWLADNPPEGPDRTVLCHGDLGPGNFMHEAGELTGLLDWEFAHLGDPMDDLAWLSIRAAQIAGLGELEPIMDLYRQRSSTPIDGARLRYYQLFVLARMAIACSVALDRPRKGTMDSSTYFVLLPLLQRQLATLLAELAGVELEPTPPVEPGSPTSSGAIISTLSVDLGSVLAPELESEAARSRLMGMSLLLSHLTTADTLGRPVEDAEIDDLEALLGARPASLDDGRRALDELIASGSGAFEALLQYLSRRADREVLLWPVIGHMASTPLPTVSSR